MNDFGKIEQDLRLSLENCACLGRDAYGNYIDKLVNSIMKQVKEVNMNEISDAQKGVINDYKLLIRRALDENYDDIADFGNIVIAMNELCAELTQFIVLEALCGFSSDKRRPKDPIRVQDSEKLSWEKE